MKAVVYNQYGQHEVLEYKEIKKPTVKNNQVLIKVKAVSINDWDWGLLRGKPFINKIMAGLIGPQKDKVLGSDISGIVSEIGNEISNLKVGDEVFGDLSGNGFGGFAEYVIAPENVLTIKSSTMSFEQAAAIPQAAVLALQAVRDNRPKETALRVLINGAGGGSGTFAVQLAKTYGDEITAVDKGDKLEMLRLLGASHVIDYTKEDFTRNGLQYDLIIDMMGYHSIFDYKNVLAPQGHYIMVGGSSGLIFQTLFIGSLISLFTNKKMCILPHQANKGMEKIKSLFDSGKVSPIIDKCYPLNKTAEAMKYFGARHSKGKVVIKVN